MTDLNRDQNNDHDNNNDNENDFKKGTTRISLEGESKPWWAPKNILVPEFIKKEMKLGTFFIMTGGLAAFGFVMGTLMSFRRNGGVRHTIRNTNKGAFRAAFAALGAGTLLSIGTTTALVLGLKKFYNINTIEEFGDRIRGRVKVIDLIIDPSHEEKKIYKAIKTKSGLEESNEPFTEEEQEIVKILYGVDFSKSDENLNNTDNNNDSSSSNDEELKNHK
eukprot:gene545-687_t